MNCFAHRVWIAAWYKQNFSVNCVQVLNGGGKPRQTCVLGSA